MQSLYSNGFESIYDAMYQTFINYSEEYNFYNNLLSKYNKIEVLEIGSGTGNLAKHFIEHNYIYTGFDFSKDMINLAKSKNPRGLFIQANMKHFTLPKPTQSIIITGRTSSYLLNNEDVNEALKSIYKNLKPQGLLCFDFIDANRFIPDIKNGKSLTHSAKFNNKVYSRDSYLSTSESENFMFHWTSKYYEIKNNKKALITEDTSVVRVFTKNEWEIFLYLNDFELIEFINKPAYMFDSYAVVARKKS